MKILIAAATWMEVKLLADELEFLKKTDDKLLKYRYCGNETDFLITGFGTTITTFRLTQTLNQQQYDLVINAGIAGSLNRKLKIGEVVNVVSDEFADLGIEKKDEFLTLFESDFIDRNEFPFKNGLLQTEETNGFIPLKKTHGITANKSHGNHASILAIKQKFIADLESMEGAAVFYVCMNMGIPCCQIRAISNYTEPFDPSEWNIPIALINLKSTLLELLKNISVPVY